MKKSNDLFKVLKNSGWLILDKITRGIFTLFVGIWVARYLGPEKYGTLSYVIAYLAFFQAASTLGLDNIVVRDIAHVQHGEGIKNPNIKLGEIIGTVLIMRFTAGLIFWIIASVGMAVYSNNQLFFLCLIAGGALLFQSFDTIDIWFQSQSQSRLTVLSKMFSYTVANGLRIFFILENFSLIYFTFAIFLESILAAVALFYSYRKFDCGGRLMVNMHGVGLKLIQESWPYLLSGISIICYMRIDQLMIKSLIGDYYLGIYSAIMPLATTWYFIPMVISVGFMPILAKNRIFSSGNFISLFKKIYLGFFIVGIILSGFTYLMAEFMVKSLFGNDYYGGIDALRIYAFSIIPVCLGFGYNLYLVNDGKSNSALYRTIAGAIATLLFSWIFIPLYGIEGASIGGLLGFIISDIVMPVILSKKLFIDLIKLK